MDSIEDGTLTGIPTEILYFIMSFIVDPTTIRSLMVTSHSIRDMTMGAVTEIFAPTQALGDSFVSRFAALKKITCIKPCSKLGKVNYIHIINARFGRELTIVETTFMSYAREMFTRCGSTFTLIYGSSTWIILAYHNGVLYLPPDLSLDFYRVRSLVASLSELLGSCGGKLSIALSSTHVHLIGESLDVCENIYLTDFSYTLVSRPPPQLTTLTLYQPIVTEGLVYATAKRVGNAILFFGVDSLRELEFNIPYPSKYKDMINTLNVGPDAQPINGEYTVTELSGITSAPPSYVSHHWTEYALANNVTFTTFTIS